MTTAEDRLEQRFVAPFYRKMWGASATEIEDRLRKRLVRASTKVTANQVHWMLLRGWREMVMGAWFALALSEQDVHDAVIDAWARVQRDDSATPLAAVSVLIAGQDAVPAMQAFLDRIGDQDDSYDVVAAAIAHLGGTPPRAPTPIGTDWFEELLRVADDLRQEFRGARR